MKRKKFIMSAMLLMVAGIGTSVICSCSEDDESDLQGNNGGGSGNAVHEYVDLGLPSGTLWATCNVGASSPEKIGDYFAWGETKPKEDYSWSTYRYFNSSSESVTKYNESDGLLTLLPEDDAATANWGKNWQMPTIKQFEELCNSNYTTTSWTTKEGVYGLFVISKSNESSIFLPAAGYRYDTILKNLGSDGYYWSSSLNKGDYREAGQTLYFKSKKSYADHEGRKRYYGLCVRPVRKK